MSDNTNDKEFYRHLSKVYSSIHQVPDTVVRREYLVEKHQSLVRTVARQVGRRSNLQRCSLDESDLFTVGILGLFDAEKRFEPEIGRSFTKFAEYRIKGAMLDELRRKDHMPRRLRAAASRLNKTEEMLGQKLGRKPTDEEVAAELDVSIEALSRLRSRIESFKFVSTDTELPISDRDPGPQEVAEEKEKHARLHSAIKKLTDREQLVLDLYFNQELTLREIAELLDVTEGRISQIKSAATGKLRDQMKAIGLTG